MARGRFDPRLLMEAKPGCTQQNQPPAPQGKMRFQYFVPWILVIGGWTAISFNFHYKSPTIMQMSRMFAGFSSRFFFFCCQGHRGFCPNLLESLRIFLRQHEGMSQWLDPNWWIRVAPCMGVLLKKQIQLHRKKTNMTLPCFTWKIDP